MPSRQGSPNKHKPFKAALNRLLDDSSGNPKLMDKIALALAKKALAGDVAALKEIADRTDGRVPQAVGGTDELDPITVVYTGVPRAGDPE